MLREDASTEPRRARRRCARRGSTTTGDAPRLAVGRGAAGELPPGDVAVPRGPPVQGVGVRAVVHVRAHPRPQAVELGLVVHLHLDHHAVALWWEGGRGASETLGACWRRDDPAAVPCWHRARPPDAVRSSHHPLSAHVAVLDVADVRRVVRGDLPVDLLARVSVIELRVRRRDLGVDVGLGIPRLRVGGIVGTWECGGGGANGGRHAGSVLPCSTSRRVDAEARWSCSGGGDAMAKRLHRRGTTAAAPLRACCDTCPRRRRRRWAARAVRAALRAAPGRGVERERWGDAVRRRLECGLP